MDKNPVPNTLQIMMVHNDIISYPNTSNADDGIDTTQPNTRNLFNLNLNKLAGLIKSPAAATYPSDIDRRFN